MSLTLEDFSDRELLFALEEHSDADGFVSSKGLAEGMGLKEGMHRNIAIRLAWLKRYGVVYREDESGRWGLTTAGERIMHGSLRAAERRALDALDEGRLYAAMEVLTTSYVDAHNEAATMAARHWRYAMAQRKRSRNGSY